MAKTPPKRPTIKDVAALAKVSHPTASRVLNDKLEGYPLKKDTIERVRQAAKTLQYRPNRSAQSLRNRKSHYIGLSKAYTPRHVRLHVSRGQSEDLERLGDARVPLADMIINMADVGYKRGYETVLLQREEDREGPIDRKHLFPDTVDGLVYIMPTLRHQEYQEIAERGYNFVLAGYCPPDTAIHSCDVDNEKALFALTRHLLESGCKRPLYFFYQVADWLILERRQAGFKRALREKGFPCREEDIQQNALDPDSAAMWIHQRLNEEPEIDGLVFANFEAYGTVKRVMQERHLQCPEQIKVAGICDGMDPIVEQEGITCMHMPLGIIARKAAELLIDVIEGKVEEVQHLEVEPVLIPRRSTTIKNEGKKAVV